MLLREQSLLGQWGNIEKVPAGAGTAAAVGKYREGSCWSRHCCGREENSWGGGIPMVAWGCWEGERERAVVGGGRERGGGVGKRGGEGPGGEKAPAGASTAVAVRKYSRITLAEFSCRTY